MHRVIPWLTVLLLATGATGGADEATDETPEFHLTIQNHRFDPSEVVVPAGKKVKLVIENRDSTPEEFESHSLKREKVVAANSTITVLVGPLTAGSYEFFGEFNPQTATGRLVAR
jgi:plastocyanin